MWHMGLTLGVAEGSRVGEQWRPELQGVGVTRIRVGVFGFCGGFLTIQHSSAILHPPPPKNTKQNPDLRPKLFLFPGECLKLTSPKHLPGVDPTDKIPDPPWGGFFLLTPRT